MVKKCPWILCVPEIFITVFFSAQPAALLYQSAQPNNLCTVSSSSKKTLLYTGSNSASIDRFARRSNTPGDHTSSIIQLPTSTAELVCYILSVLLFLFYGLRKSSVLVVYRGVRRPKRLRGNVNKNVFCFPNFGLFYCCSDMSQI